MRMIGGLLLSLWVLPVFSQKILPDTFYIDLAPDRVLTLENVAINRVVDNRPEDPRFVRYGSKNKFLLIPVDQEVYLNQPLSEAIRQGIPDTVATGANYSLYIEKFVIENQTRRFTRPVILVADLKIYSNHPDTSIYEGTLYYDFLYRPVERKESLAQSSQNLLHQWHEEFKIDLLSLRAIYEDQPVVQNFIADDRLKSLYLNAGTDFFLGYNWWGIQGEVSFTRPETNNRSRHTGTLIRYLNNPDYESFAIGKKSEHLLFRRSPGIAFDLDFNMLLGFCKWKDIDKESPTLYQIFDFEVSSVQSVLINPLNRAGILLRLGLIENFSYVIGKDPKLQVGLTLGAGIKI